MGEKFTSRVGYLIRNFRIASDMTQKELADKIGVSKQTIFVMEKGKYIPTLLLAFRIATFFKVDITDIFSYDLGGAENEN